jgi:hypothetical protein
MRKLILSTVVFLWSSLSSLTTTVIVPCYYGHVQYLRELFDALSQQTVLPDEAVISISQAHLVDPLILEDFLSRQYPFKIQVLSTNNKLYAGENRNAAAKVAKGDILICQDADDLPHMQRIEFIKRSFEEKEISLLVHTYIRTNNSSRYWGPYNYLDVPLFQIRRWNDVNLLDSLTFGNPSCLRKVFDQIQWPNWKNGEDKKFLISGMIAGFSLWVLDANLFLYRNELSSGV